MNTIFSKVGEFLGGLTGLMLSLVSLSIIAEVLFGVGVFGVDVIKNVMELITMLGGGFVGLVALLILWNLFAKKDK